MSPLNVIFSNAVQFLNIPPCRYFASLKTQIFRSALKSTVFRYLLFSNASGPKAVNVTFGIVIDVNPVFIKENDAKS